MPATRRRNVLGVVLVVTVAAWAVTGALYHLGRIGDVALIVMTFHLSWAAMAATVGTLFMEADTQVEVASESDETQAVCQHCGQPPR